MWGVIGLEFQNNSYKEIQNEMFFSSSKDRHRTVAGSAQVRWESLGSGPGRGEGGRSWEAPGNYLPTGERGSVSRCLTDFWKELPFRQSGGWLW